MSANKRSDTRASERTVIGSARRAAFERERMLTRAAVHGRLARRVPLFKMLRRDPRRADLGRHGVFDACRRLARSVRPLAAVRVPPRLAHQLVVLCEGDDCRRGLHGFRQLVLRLVEVVGVEARICGVVKPIHLDPARADGADHRARERCASLGYYSVAVVGSNGGRDRSDARSQQQVRARGGVQSLNRAHVMRRDIVGSVERWLRLARRRGNRADGATLKR